MSPYRLASMKGSPIAVVFSHARADGIYRIEVAKVIRVPEGIGRQNEVYRSFAQQFVDALEDYADRHPWQFYNFFDMWQRA